MYKLLPVLATCRVFYLDALKDTKRNTLSSQSSRISSEKGGQIDRQQKCKISDDKSQNKGIIQRAKVTQRREWLFLPAALRINSWGTYLLRWLSGMRDLWNRNGNVLPSPWEHMWTRVMVCDRRGRGEWWGCQESGDKTGCGAMSTMLRKPKFILK